MPRIKITQEDIERAREKNRRRIPTLTIDKDLIESRRPQVLPSKFVRPGRDVPTAPPPDDIDDNTLPYVGETDPTSGKILTAEDEVVRCKTEGRYHLKASWDEFGRCPTCGGTECYDKTDAGLATLLLSETARPGPRWREHSDCAHYLFYNGGIASTISDEIPSWL